MIATAQTTTFEAPDVDYAGLSPIIALTAGVIVVLLAGLVGPRGNRWLSSALTLLTLAITAGLMIWRVGEPAADLVSGALRVDGLSLTIGLMCVLAAAFAVLLQLRDEAAEESGFGESHALLLGSVLGMAMIAGAQNLITFFVALELLSIPLYVLCGSHRMRGSSLESGLKYLIVGSLGSATLLYGMAFIYGGSGSTDFTEIAAGIGPELSDDPLILIGIALCAVGLAFKVSIAPFHQWTPDVYQGAPSPVTGFMASVAKAGGFAALLRVFFSTFTTLEVDWQPLVGTLAVITLLVGSVVAIVQSDIKRMLAYSSISHAGYILVGLQAATNQGVASSLFYLLTYSFMALGSFAVVTIVGRRGDMNHDLESYKGLSARRPGLALVFTVLRNVPVPALAWLGSS